MPAVGPLEQCNRAGQKYCGTRKELFAIVKGVNHFYPYLYGHHFLLCRNHAALKWLLSLHHLKGQVVRWLERLEEYHFKAEQLAGLKHVRMQMHCQDHTVCNKLVIIVTG